MRTPTEHHQGDSKWKPGDRVHIQVLKTDGLTYRYQMATLVLRDFAGQWWFKIDGLTYPTYEGGPDLSFCVERWIHEPPVLDRLADISRARLGLVEHE